MNVLHERLVISLGLEPRDDKKQTPPKARVANQASVNIESSRMQNLFGLPVATEKNNLIEY